MKKKFKEYFLEMIIVSFGVFLGLIVSDWNAQRKVDTKTTKSLEFIIKEVKKNAELYKKSKEYHLKIKIELDSISTYVSEKDLELNYYQNTKFKPEFLPSWRGVKTVNPEDIAFGSAKLNGIYEELDVKTVQLISEANKLNLKYGKMTKIVFDKYIFINSISKTRDVWEIFQLIGNDILYNEDIISKRLHEISLELSDLLKEGTY